MARFNFLFSWYAVSRNHFLFRSIYAKHPTNINSGVASMVHLTYVNLILCARKRINTNENISYSAHDFICHYIQAAHATKWVWDGRNCVPSNSLSYRVVGPKPYILSLMGDLGELFKNNSDYNLIFALYPNFRTLLKWDFTVSHLVLTKTLWGRYNY